jgi:hypothetical protein
MSRWGRDGYGLCGKLFETDEACCDARLVRRSAVSASTLSGGFSTYQVWALAMLECGCGTILAVPTIEPAQASLL